MFLAKVFNKCVKGIIHHESLSINGIRSIIPDQQSLQYMDSIITVDKIKDN